MGIRRRLSLYAIFISACFLFMGGDLARVGCDSDIYQKAEECIKERKRLQIELSNIVQADPSDAKSIPKKLRAISLLGKIGDEKVIPLLIENLGLCPGLILEPNDVGKTEKTVAMDALVNLGALSIKPLVDSSIEKENEIQLRQHAQVMNSLKEREMVLILLRARYGVSSKERKKRIEYIYERMTGKIMSE